MNLRALTRGDAAVAGAAVLLLLASFLPYRSVRILSTSTSWNAWESSAFPLLPSTFLLGIIGAALILLFRLQKDTLGSKEILGLRLDQWGTAAAVFAFWGMLWAVLGTPSGATTGLGAWLGLLSSLVLAGAVIAGPLVPELLQAPLLPAAGPSPAATTPQPFPPYGGQQGQPAGYGYPGAAQPQAQQQPFPGQPQPQHVEQPVAPQYGGGQPAGGYGYPQAAQAPAAQAAPQPTAVQPAIQDHVPPQAAAAPFAPFWFAVPAVRQLADKDNPAAPPVGELVPGTWYLAVDQRGAALVAQLPDGSHGVLNDTNGIQRG